MIISQIVAMGENGVIGRDNGLPWRISSDLKRFKALTLGKPVVMGRKCYESIGKPLPGRPNIVVSRNRDFQPEGVIVSNSMDAALAQAHVEAEAIDAEEICVIGGGEIYRQALDRTDYLKVTYVPASPEGDTYFPGIEASVWEVVEDEDVPRGDKDDFATRFVVYRRKSSS